MATDIVTWSVTTVALVQDVTIHFFQVHVVDYYRRTARYIDGVHQDEEMLQQQAQMASEGQGQLTKDLVPIPSKQMTIAEVAAPGGFRPDEVVPYLALLLEPFVRAQVKYRYMRSPLQTMEDALEPLLRRIQAWFGKLMLGGYIILVLGACYLIMWLLSIFAPLIPPLIALFQGLKWIAINLWAFINGPRARLGRWLLFALLLALVFGLGTMFGVYYFHAESEWSGFEDWRTS